MLGAVIAVLLAPVGRVAPGLWLMELGARWILAIAPRIAGGEERRRQHTASSNVRYGPSLTAATERRRWRKPDP